MKNKRIPGLLKRDVDGILINQMCDSEQEVFNKTKQKTTSAKSGEWFNKLGWLRTYLLYTKKKLCNLNFIKSPLCVIVNSTFSKMRKLSLNLAKLIQGQSHDFLSLKLMFLTSYII